MLAATRKKRDTDKLRKESDTNDLLFNSLLFQILTGGLLAAALDWYYFWFDSGDWKEDY